jgi:rhodanese-related sulfurtransferase
MNIKEFGPMGKIDIHPRMFLDSLDKGELKDSLILDVRENYEWEYYHLDEAALMPMNTIPHKLHEIPEDRDIYVVCAHGVRSQMVCEFLRENGVERAINVNGGMAAIGMLRGFQYD